MPLRETEVELDLTHDTPDDLDGQTLLPEGKYHILVTSVTRKAGGDSPHLSFRYQVLAGTDPAAAGLSSSERFYLTAEALGRLKILATRAGLIGEQDFGRKKTPDFSRLAGVDLVAEV